MSITTFNSRRKIPYSVYKVLRAYPGWYAKRVVVQDRKVTEVRVEKNKSQIKTIDPSTLKERR